MALGSHSILPCLSKVNLNHGPIERQTRVSIESDTSFCVALDGIKSRIEVKVSYKSSFEDVLYHLLKNPHISQPDNHTFGIYNSVCDGNYYELEGKLFFLDYTRFEQKLKLCSLPREIKSKYRKLAFKKEGAQLHHLSKDVYFGTCFRFMIGKRFVTHMNSFRTIHALKMAFAIFTTTRLYDYEFSTSRRLQHHKNGEYKYVQRKGAAFSVLFLYLCRKMKKCKTEKDLIKKIKLSYCSEFSRQTGQEMPDGHENSFPIFPPSVNVRHSDEANSKLSSDELLQFHFSVLQSKSLCHEVSLDFIQESLKEHYDTLCTGPSIEVPDALKCELTRQGKLLGEYLSIHYDPYTTRKASSSSSYNFSRKRGGCLGELYSKNMVKINSHLLPDPENRMEPIVIGLFGPPGCGKTTLVQDLVNRIQKKFFGELSLKNSHYSRSCSSEFWDGYKNQPIVILDDFGQSSDRKDVVEFQQLVSVNQYQLNMASLEDKGRCFTSQFIIVTSNMDFGSGLGTAEKLEPVEDNLAFWRRFHLSFHLGIYGRDDHMYMTDRLSKVLVEGEHFGIPPHYYVESGAMRKAYTSVFSNSTSNLPVSYDNITFNTPDALGRHERKGQKSVLKDFKPFPRKDIFSIVCRTYISSLDYHNEGLSKTWKQKVFSNTLYKREISGTRNFENVLGQTLDNKDYDIEPQGLSIEYEFENFPPEGPLRVRAEAISEPLKCRIITAGDCSTWCLKPLQIAMWKYLGTKPQFVLTHGTQNLEKGVLRCSRLDFSDALLRKKIKQIGKQSKDDQEIWVSGDYKSATDNFRLECGSIILNEAFKYISHEPTKRWAMKELSSHIIDYPITSGIPSGIQRNGQLMGSLLSFPLLCLVNDSTAYLAGANPNKYLINGDDILIKCNQEIYENWKKVAPQLGLTLSIGKTFVSPHFGTVNSQLFIEGKQVTTGKHKLTTRRQQVLGECFRDLYRKYGEKNPDSIIKLFKTLNRPNLTKTYESLHVSTHMGGLGLVTLKNYDYQKRDLYVYFSKIMRKLKPIKGVLKFPYLAVDNCPSSIDPISLLEMPSPSDILNIVTGKDIFNAQRLVETNPQLRETAQAMLDGSLKFEDLPPLSVIRIKEIQTTDNKVSQDSINNRFLNLCSPDYLKSLEFKNLNKNYRAELENHERKALGLVTEKLEINYYHYGTELPELVELIGDPIHYWNEKLAGPSLFTEPNIELNLPSVEKFERKLVEIQESDIEPIDYKFNDKYHEHLDSENICKELLEEVTMLP